MWDTHSIISATAGVISLGVGLGLWWWSPAEDRQKWWHDLAVLILVFAGGAGLKNTKGGDWVNWGVDKVTGLIGSLAITIGVGLGLGIIAVLVVIAIVQKYRDDGAQPWMLVADGLLPFVVGSIPGGVGVFLTVVLGYVAAAPAWLIAAGFGIN